MKIFKKTSDLDGLGQADLSIECLINIFTCFNQKLDHFMFETSRHFQKVITENIGGLARIDGQTSSEHKKMLPLAFGFKIESRLRYDVANEW